MIAYRLSKGLYKNDLSGRGAEIAGGRWNSKGTALLYTCESRALCTTEIAVHTPLGIVPVDYWLITLEIPDELLLSEVLLSDLPPTGGVSRTPTPPNSSGTPSCARAARWA
nr:RES family NAD+ phosphorylase [Rufibacter sediminis]